LDILNLVLIVSILIIGFFFVKFYFLSSNTQKKPAALKKDELVSDYENQMQDIITLYANDDETLRFEKTQLLKQVSKELATNIFFDKQEVRDLLTKLANMH